MVSVLEVRNASKSFPGVLALDDVSLEIRPNEVVGLIGENGAGKSTLLKALNGAYWLDRGEIRVNGEPVDLKGPRDAFDHGIAMVYQEQSVLRTLSVAENVFLGRESEFTRFGVLNKAAMNAAARTELENVHLDVDPAVRVKIFYGANATIRAFPLSGSHITRFSMCALSFPNRISTGIGKIQATPTLRGANERSRTATHSPNPLLPLDLHYSIRNVHPAVLCGDLTFAQRQMVEIANAVSLDSRIDGNIVVLLDEPTSVLESKEIEVLFGIVRELKQRAAFVFISHRLDEVMDLSDRIYVMRDGKVVSEMPSAEATVSRLRQLMVGRTLRHEYYRESRQGDPQAEVVLEARSITSPAGFRDVSFTLRKGEILGIAGVIESGREALARCLAGLAPIESGTLLVRGRECRFSHAADAVARGIGYLPQDRRVEGLVTGAPVFENMTLAALRKFARGGIVRAAKEAQVAGEWIERLGIKTPSAKTYAGSLSGGNQQKVVLSKWHIANSSIMILDHPTRGIDVGAKEDVYDLIRDMTDAGLSVILLGDTLEEVIGLSHRILVMRDGVVSARFDAEPEAKPDQIQLIQYMV